MAHSRGGPVKSTICVSRCGSEGLIGAAISTHCHRDSPDGAPQIHGFREKFNVRKANSGTRIDGARIDGAARADGIRPDQQYRFRCDVYRPSAIDAAPGQILNLMVQGVGASLTGRVAEPFLPLPDVLAGISVKLVQAPQSVAVPILAVRPVITCANGESAPCGSYTVVTVQIPYELSVPCQPAISVCPSQVSTPFVTVPPQLIVSENGVAGGAVDLNPLLRSEEHTAELQ